MDKRINLNRGAGMLARNRCCRCGHEWHDKPMGFARFPSCPRCGSDYWEWINYAGRGDDDDAG